ncbi:MAG: hypothetical protein V7707_02465 [Motiliproteus sp.]
MSSPDIRLQARDDAKNDGKAENGTSFVLSTQELFNLINLCGFAERARKMRSTTISQLCEFIVTEGYEFVTGDEEPYRNSHYSDASESRELLSLYGLKADPKRRTLPAKHIMELPSEKRHEFLHAAIDWERERHQEIAQFSVSLKTSPDVYAQLREVHYRHLDNDSNAFDRPGRAIRLILRDYHAELTEKLGKNDRIKQPNNQHFRNLQRLWTNPKDHIADLPVFLLLDSTTELSESEASETVSQLLDGLSTLIQAEDGADMHRKVTIAQLLTSRAIMMMNDLLAADDLVDKHATTPQKLSGHQLSQLATYIPVEWTIGHINGLLPENRERLKVRMKAGSPLLSGIRHEV